MVWQVYVNARNAKCLDYCCVATDDQRVAEAVRTLGGEVVMTNVKWESDAERCLEAYRKIKKRMRKGDDFDVIVEVSCDEPFIQPHHIGFVAQLDFIAGHTQKIYEINGFLP